MRLIFGVLLAATLVSPTAYADGFTASVGADFSTGKYGDSESTDVWYVPFAASYNTGAFTYKVTVPWIRVNGPGDVIPGGFGGSGGAAAAGSSACSGLSNSGSGNARKTCEAAAAAAAVPPAPGAPAAATTTRTSESGLGDIIAGVTYNAYNGGDQGFVVDLSGRIKFGTASDTRGLGSGKTDFAVQTNIDKNFGPAYASFGLGYKWLGEPSGVNFKNVIFGSLGGGYRFDKDTEVGASYDWATAAVSGADRPQELSVYASHYLNNNYKLSGVLYGGFTDASPDIGGGVTLNYYF